MATDQGTDAHRHCGNTTVVQLTDESGGVDPDALRTALLDVLTHCPHEDLARPAVLADVAAERAHRRNDPNDPWSADDSKLARLADLTGLTGQVASATVECGGHPAAVYSALARLAACSP